MGIVYWHRDHKVYKYTELHHINFNNNNNNIIIIIIIIKCYIKYRTSKFAFNEIVWQNTVDSLLKDSPIRWTPL